MWEGRSKDRREKSKYTEWECGDRSQDNLLICIPTHSGKQLTTGWICFLITLCLLSISLHSACSHLKKLSPARHPPLCSVRTVGVTMTLHPVIAVLPCFPLAWKLDWGNENRTVSPDGVFQKGKGNFFLPPAQMSLWRPWCKVETTHGTWENRERECGRSEPWAKICEEDKVLLLHPSHPHLWEIMSLPAAIIADYMSFACCIKAAGLINIALKGGLSMKETSCFELQ